jgi:hypothetical protein
MRLSIRMAQPCCSLTTWNVIIVCHREWTARNLVLTSLGAWTIGNCISIQPRGESAALIYVKCPGGCVPEVKEKNLPDAGEPSCLGRT